MSDYKKTFCIKIELKIKQTKNNYLGIANIQFWTSEPINPFRCVKSHTNVYFWERNFHHVVIPHANQIIITICQSGLNQSIATE